MAFKAIMMTDNFTGHFSLYIKTERTNYMFAAAVL